MRNAAMGRASEMGRGPDGWMTGFLRQVMPFICVPHSEVTDQEYLRLIAVLIALASFNLRHDGAADCGALHPDQSR